MDEFRARSWHDAVLAATFDFFEPVGANQTGRWASGFGGGPNVTGSLVVSARIGGSDVSVETSSSPRLRPASLQRRMIATDVVSHVVMAVEAELELPMSIVIVGDDRVIDVDGSPVTFEGCRVEGDARWIGVADHAGVRLTITAAGGDDLALRRCVEWESLTDTPPPD